MYWRVTGKQFQAQKGEGNRQSMKAMVDSGTVPGLLGYRQGRPAAWCSLAPRQDYPFLARSRILKPLDDQPCWSVSCLFIERGHRRKGFSVQMLRAAVEYARSQGAELLEGYPVEPKGGKPIPAAFAWTGIPNAFLSAGFHEVARRSPTRPIMRISLDSSHLQEPSSRGRG